MTAIDSIDASQRQAATVVGFSYLLVNATGIFTEVYGRGFIVADAVQTARNIVAHEQLFRLGIASYLVCMLGDTALATFHYVILRRINHNVALFATFLRLVECTIGVVATLESFDVLRLLSGADYLRVFTPEQLAALTRIPISANGSAINVSFVFLGFGSALFSYLWLESGYVPKSLAVLGIAASMLLAAGTFAFLIVPDLRAILFPWYMLPMGVFELTMGFWLLLKGLPRSRVAHA